MKKIALLLLIAAEALGVQAQQITIHEVNGDTILVGLRRKLPVSAPRVRYPGFHPDKRGTNMSQGNILYWGHEDALDAKDVIGWITHQSWSNQKVGMVGNSWLTASQWFIASERPPYLAAIAPWEVFSDLYRDSDRGGIPMPEFAEMIAETFSSQYGLLENQPLMLAKEPYWCNYWKDKAPN